jgi:hypothetical protein
MLLFAHRQLEAVGKRFFMLADECGQTLKQMKVSATIVTLHEVISSLITAILFKNPRSPSNRATRTHLDE